MSEPIQESILVMPQQCVAVRVSLIHRGVMNLYNKALHPLNLRITQMFILVLTQRNGKTTPGELCKALNLEPSTLCRNVQRMKKNGWIQVNEEKNGRNQILELTPKGRELVGSAVPLWKGAQRQVREFWSQQQIEALDDLASCWLHLPEADSGGPSATAV